MLMRSEHISNIAVLACAVSVVAYAAGPLALVAVPALVGFYVAAIYKRCPFRTEVIFLSLFSAYFMLAYIAIWLLYVLRASGTLIASNVAAGMLFVLPLITVGVFVVSGLGSRANASIGTSATQRVKWRSGNLIVAFLLAPAWAYAAVLAWLAWK